MPLVKAIAALSTEENRPPEIDSAGEDILESDASFDLQHSGPFYVKKSIGQQKTLENARSAGRHVLAEVGDRVRDLRLALQMRQDEVADATDGVLHRVQVVQIETGKNKLSTDRARRALAQAFRLHPDDFVLYLDRKIELRDVLARREILGAKTDANPLIEATAIYAAYAQFSADFISHWLASSPDETDPDLLWNACKAAWSQWRTAHKQGLGSPEPSSRKSSKPPRSTIKSMRAAPAAPSARKKT